MNVSDNLGSILQQIAVLSPGELAELRLQIERLADGSGVTLTDLQADKEAIAGTKAKRSLSLGSRRASDAPDANGERRSAIQTIGGGTRTGLGHNDGG